jgi:F0F1-type ATP synthase assembly protein I
MVETVDQSAPGFLEGTEVARSKRINQPGFDEQLPLLERDKELKKKLAVAIIVISAVFLAGIIAGAILGIFV